jgi:Domain of unknown function (DUF932)
MTQAIALDKYQSINATHEHFKTSEKYRFIPTTKVVDILAREGWLPSRVQEMRVRNEGRVGFQKHLIRFRQQGMMGGRVGDIIPEVVLTNAHDGSASFVFDMGLFRQVCGNGAVVSEGMFASVRVRHVGFTTRQVLAAVQNVIEETPKVLDRVGDYRSIMLTEDERRIFAEGALLLKLNEEHGERGTGSYNSQSLFSVGDRSFDTARLLSPYRSDDREPTLWNTYNVIQGEAHEGRAVRGHPARLADDRSAHPQDEGPAHQGHQRGRASQQRALAHDGGDGEAEAVTHARRPGAAVDSDASGKRQGARPPNLRTGAARLTFERRKPWERKRLKR